MLVSNILAAKGGGDVATISPQASIADAARELSARRIGALVVTDDSGRPAGIISERDIVRDAGQCGADCLTKQVSSLMTQDLVTCGSGDTSDSVLERMTQGRFRHMPVVDNGQMVGLVSIGDVVKVRLSELAMEKDAMTDLIMGH